MKTETCDVPAAPGSHLYGLYVLAITVALGGNLLVRVAERGGWLGPTARTAVAAVAVIPLAVGAGLFWRWLRRDLDEMVQRIVLEGLAFAFIIYLPIAALFVNLRTAGAWVPHLDSADILLSPGLLVAIGVLLAWRRVQ
jgi:hypothetical protein